MCPAACSAVTMLPPMAPAPPVTTATRLTGGTGTACGRAARAAAFAPASRPNTRASVSPPPCSIR